MKPSRIHIDRRQRRHNAKWFFIPLFVFVVTAVVLWLILPSERGVVRQVLRNGPLHSSRPTATPTATPTPFFEPNQVLAQWQTIKADYPSITISAELIDLASGEKVELDAGKSFRAASTTKLIAATYFLHQVEQKKYTLDQMIGDTAAQRHLQLMINRSDNDSWKAFIDLLGPANEEKFAHSQGWTSFDISTNHIAVHDLADLLYKLWRGDLLSRPHTDLLLSYMRDTNDERWIPAGLPDEAIVYHKYGALEDDLHDAAIIQHQGTTFVLVIMTNANGAYAYDQRSQIFYDMVQSVFAAKAAPSPTR